MTCEDNEKKERRTIISVSQYTNCACAVRYRGIYICIDNEGLGAIFSISAQVIYIYIQEGLGI